MSKITHGWWFLFAMFALWELTTQQQRFCGKNLAQMMQGICPNGYQSKALEKKSDNLLMYDDDDDYVMSSEGNSVEDPSLEMFWPYLHRYKAYQFSARSRSRYLRETRIVDECCKKACHYQELLSYCD